MAILYAAPFVIARAATCDLAIAPGSLAVIPTSVTHGQRSRIYVTLDGTCDDDIEGTVTFFEQGSSIGLKPFSIRSKGKSEEVWLNWIPTIEGNREIRVEASGSTDNPPLSLNRSASVLVMIDRDTDSDGIPDRLDTDRDNDGLTDEEEARMRTDPLRIDTDQDGMDDKRDAFPLDPNRTKLPPPPPPTTPPPPPPPSPPSPPPQTSNPETQISKPSAVQEKSMPVLVAKREAFSQTRPAVSTKTTAVSPQVSATSTVKDFEAATTTEMMTTTTEVLIIPTISVSTSVNPSVIQSQLVEKKYSSIPGQAKILITLAAVSAGIAGFFLWKARKI